MKWIWQQKMLSKPWLNIWVVLAAAFLLDVAYYFFLSGTPSFGESSSILSVFALLIGISIITFVGWNFSHSIRLAIGGVIATFILGMPIAVFLLMPVSSWFWTRLTSFGDIVVYGSIQYISVIVMLVVPVLVVNQWALFRKNWQYFILAICLSSLVASFFEILSLSLPHNTQLTLVKLILYTPWVWFWAVFGIQIRQ